MEEETCNDMVGVSHTSVVEGISEQGVYSSVEDVLVAVAKHKYKAHKQPLQWLLHKMRLLKPDEANAPSVQYKISSKKLASKISQKRLQFLRTLGSRLWFHSRLTGDLI